jgi:hypothetical protein
MKILAAQILLLVASCSTAPPRHVVAVDAPPAARPALICSLPGVDAENVEAWDKQRYCEQSHDPCCATAGDACHASINWYQARLYCLNVHDACCESGNPDACDGWKAYYWYGQACGGWEGTLAGAWYAGRFPGRVVQVEQEATNCGGAHVYVEVVIDGHTRLLHAGDHCLWTTLSVGAHVVADVTLTTRPIGGSAFSSLPPTDGFARIVSPDCAITRGPGGDCIR